jgi:hypothetical protein
MKVAVCRLKSVSPYSQSRPSRTPKLDKESADAHEKRTWRDRIHTNADGMAFIPPMAFKNCLSEAAKYLSEKIPGKGQATYTKHFEAGVLVIDGPALPIKSEDVEGEWLFLNADGKRGGGKRVWKCYPVFREWEVEVRFYVADETVTEDVFKHHLSEAGKFIGIGRFRPRNNGFYGRFELVDIKWE